MDKKLIYITVGLILVFVATAKANIMQNLIPDNGKLNYPVKGKLIVTSPFGWRILRGVKDWHNGVDLISDDQNVYAPANGIVDKIYSNDLGGKQMVISHYNGYTTGYADIGQCFVAVGQLVQQGQKICTMGTGGNATGVHIHFTVREKNATATIDPLKVLS